MSRRDSTPRGLGPCDLLTVREALAVLGMSESEGRQLLRERGLVRRFAGRPRVVAGELAQAHDEAWTDRAPVPAAPAALPSWDELE